MAGGPEVTKATPTLYVYEGRVVLRAPRTEGEFRMLQTGWRKFSKEAGDFAARRLFVSNSISFG